MAIRDEPYGGFNVLVDLGDGSGEVAGGFRTVRGIGTSLDVITYRNGDDRSGAPRQLPGLRHYSRVVLSRGVVGDLRLWQWASQEPPDKRTVVITLLDERREPVLRFVLLDAFPTRWEGPDLDAQASDVAVETLELCYDGLRVEAD